jgi:hypothetical protein
VKPNTFVRRHSLKIAVLGCLAFAAQVACSDEPVSGGGGFAGTTSTGGTTAPVAGTTSTAGTTAAAGTASGGTFGTAGTGGTFGTAGTDVGGTTSGGTGGTGTAGTATAGTGGTGVIVIPPLDCTNTGKPLPVALSAAWGFPDSGDNSFSEAPIATGADVCTAAGAPAGAVGCWSMTWTPVATTGRDYVFWVWHDKAANWTGQGTCVAAGAKVISLRAKADAPTTVSFEAVGVKQAANLTTEWQDVAIPLPADYNNVNPLGGVNAGLAVVMVRADKADVTVRKIYWSDVQWAVSAPTGGGEGGAGGAGGAGG